MAETIKVKAGDPIPPGNWRVIGHDCVPSMYYQTILERIPDAPPAPPILMLPDGEPRVSYLGATHYIDAKGRLWTANDYEHELTQFYKQVTPAATGEQLRNLLEGRSRTVHEDMIACLKLADQLRVR